MSTILLEPVHSLPAFSNEPVADFSKPPNRQAMEKALRDVHAELGREYDLLIGGAHHKTADKLQSLNPSRPREVVGIHNKATADLAREAVEFAKAIVIEVVISANDN